jgi:hypothetical protein
MMQIMERNQGDFHISRLTNRISNECQRKAFNRLNPLIQVNPIKTSSREAADIAVLIEALDIGVVPAKLTLPAK